MTTLAPPEAIEDSLTILDESLDDAVPCYQPGCDQPATVRAAPPCHDWVLLCPTHERYWKALREGIPDFQLMCDPCGTMFRLRTVVFAPI